MKLPSADAGGQAVAETDVGPLRPRADRPVDPRLRPVTGASRLCVEASDLHPSDCRIHLTQTPGYSGTRTTLRAMPPNPVRIFCVNVKSLFPKLTWIGSLLASCYQTGSKKEPIRSAPSGSSSISSQRGRPDACDDLLPGLPPCDTNFPIQLCIGRLPYRIGSHRGHKGHGGLPTIFLCVPCDPCERFLLSVLVECTVNRRDGMKPDPEKSWCTSPAHVLTRL
jgi:hypothetical protein